MLGARSLPGRAGNSVLDNTQTSLAWVSPESELRNQSVDVELRKPFEENFLVEVGRSENSNKKNVHNCLDYLSVRTSITDWGPSMIANILRIQAVRCDALDLLSHARQASHPCFERFTFTRLTAKNLPAKLSLVVSREDERDVKNASIRGLPVTFLSDHIVWRPRGQNVASLIVPSQWSSRLTVIARADFLGNGEEELMVRSETSVTDGTYRTLHLYLLGCPAMSKVFPVISER